MQDIEVPGGGRGGRPRAVLGGQQALGGQRLDFRRCEAEVAASGPQGAAVLGGIPRRGGQQGQALLVSALPIGLGLK